MFSLIAMTIKLSIVIWVGTFWFANLVNREDAKWVMRKPLAIMIGFFGIALFAHNVWIVYAMMVAALPALAKSRGEAVGLFVVAIAALPELSSGLKFGSATILGVDKWICLSLGFAWVLLKHPRVGVRTGARFDAPFLIMLSLELIQARDQNFTSTFRTILSSALAMGMPYFMLTSSIARVEDLRRVMIAIAYVGFVHAFIGIYESVSHVLTYLQLNSQLGLFSEFYKAYKFRGGLLRPQTTFGDSSTFAIALVIMLMATVACRMSFKSTGKFAIALAVISLGIFVTSTRNAWIGAVICMLAFDLYRRRFVSLVGKGMILGMGYAVMLTLAQFSRYVATMMGKSDDTAGTADYRTRLLTRGIEEFHKHPLAGVDPGRLYAAMQDMKQGEGIVDFVNAYLYYSLVCGIWGIIGLALVFLLSCLAMLRIRKALAAQGPLVQRTAAFVFSVSLSFFVTSAFTAFGGRGSMFFYLTVGIGGVLFSWRKVPTATLAATDRPTAVRPPPPVDAFAPVRI